MQFFVDSADIQEIKKLHHYGIIDGVTTNPSLIAKSGCSIFDFAQELCSFVTGPVSLEVAATEYDLMLEEGTRLSLIANNVVVKLPMNLDGIKACRYFSAKGIMVNMTLCFSPAQAILAAKAGASFVSPFVGRLEDVGQDGMSLISQIRQIYNNYAEFNTKILVASVRNILHIVESAKIGADVVTVPAKILTQLIEHPLTEKGIDIFIKDWKNTGQKI
jgi:transaldolase